MKNQLRYIKSIATHNVRYRAGWSDEWEEYVVRYFINDRNFLFPLVRDGCPLIDGKQYSSFKKGAEYLINHYF